jgi:hypothetical protein
MTHTPKIKEILHHLNSYIFLSTSVAIWVFVIRIFVNLKPIADEVCVSGEWKEKAIFPPYHNSPRVLGSLFTWMLAPIWKFEYPLAFLTVTLIITLLLYRLFSRSFQNAAETELSVKSKIVVTSAAVPWIIFALPPNKSALFDSVFWFGGSWHLIGALIVCNAVISILRQEPRGCSFYFWILLASFWSEITASIMFVVLFLNLRSDKRNLKAMLLPATALILNLIVNLGNSRISIVHQDDSRNNLIIFKGSIKMIAEYGLASLLIAIILSSIFLPLSIKAKSFPKRQINWIILLTTLAMISIYLVGYPTWRSSSIIGALLLTLQLLVFLRRARNGYSSLLSILITIILGLNTLSSLKSIESVVAERSTWWEHVITKEEPVFPFDFSGDNTDFLQADYGSSEWIDECFNKLIVKRVD